VEVRGTALIKGVTAQATRRITTYDWSTRYRSTTGWAARLRISASPLGSTMTLSETRPAMRGDRGDVVMAVQSGLSQPSARSGMCCRVVVLRPGGGSASEVADRGRRERGAVRRCFRGARRPGGARSSCAASSGGRLSDCEDDRLSTADAPSGAAVDAVGATPTNRAPTAAATPTRRARTGAASTRASSATCSAER
jgi:hypothetical protein